MLFRCDGGAGIGEGHLLRTLPVAEALAARGHKCTLLTSTPDAPGLAAWRQAGIEIVRGTFLRGTEEDTNETCRVAFGMASQAGSIKGAAWAAIDNYAFAAPLLGRLPGDLRTLVYDDLGLFDPAASIVVNQNAGADVTFAKAYPASKMKLLGTRYAAIRQAVADALRVDEGYVLVCLGGSSDPALAAEVASEVASAIPSRDVVLVAGADPASSADGAGRERFAHLPTQELAPLISRAHIAVIGGGVTALEAAYLGVPAVVLILAENQRPGALALARTGACVTFEGAAAAGRAVAELIGDPARLRQMAAAGTAEVDGLGARRVADALVEFSGEALL
ncbi:MAG: hypothetical protein WDZ83_08965 [Rhizobiaceae bacterium]